MPGGARPRRALARVLAVVAVLTVSLAAAELRRGPLGYTPLRVAVACCVLGLLALRLSRIRVARLRAQREALVREHLSVLDAIDEAGRRDGLGRESTAGTAPPPGWRYVPPSAPGDGWSATDGILTVRSGSRGDSEAQRVD